MARPAHRMKARFGDARALERLAHELGAHLSVRSISPAQEARQARLARRGLPTVEARPIARAAGLQRLNRIEELFAAVQAEDSRRAAEQSGDQR